MNIKSLILGSATVALAATGAQAADAIVIAEPEPVEYVRVCDVYGAGYFYIPGTETCLRVSGWVRHQLGSNIISGKHLDRGIDSSGALITVAPPNTNPNRVNRRQRGLNQTTGAQINFDARSETEYGTLRGWVQLEGTDTNISDNGDINILINRALIQLGGLYMGYADSLFSSSSNFGGSSLGNTVGFTYADTFGYHYEQRQQIGYQFDAGNGFWGAVAVEHDPDSGATTNYAPDIVGKIAYQQAWGGVWLAAGYDETAKGAGVRGGIQAVFSPVTVRLDGYYKSKANVSYGLTSRWGIQATALYQINPKLGIAGGIGYLGDTVQDGAAVHALANAVGVGAGGTLVGVPTTATDYFSGGHAWQAQIGLNWQPVQNFQIGADLVYNKAKFSQIDTANNRFTRNSDATSFRLRFQRNF